jgi:hypothetical protein
MTYFVNFSPFLSSKMVRDLITFNFRQEGQSTPEYIEQVFTAAEFLKYDADEQQLVDLIIMNLHPSVLAQEAFFERPRSRKDLYSVVGLIEEKFSVLKERQRTQSGDAISRGSELRNQAQSRNIPANSRPRGCCICGGFGHTRRNCRQRNPKSGNVQMPAGRQTTGQEH